MHGHNTDVKMADSASELESDASSIDGGLGGKISALPQIEELQKNIERYAQENKALKLELDTFKLKCKSLQEENRDLRRASVSIVRHVTY